MRPGDFFRMGALYGAAMASVIITVGRFVGIGVAVGVAVLLCAVGFVIDTRVLR